jgi:hypothetical protein
LVDWLQTIHVSAKSGCESFEPTCRMCDQNNASRCAAGQTRL